MSHIIEVPNEVVIQILEYCDLKSACSLSSTCTTFHVRLEDFIVKKLQRMQIMSYSMLDPWKWIGKEEELIYMVRVNTNLLWMIDGVSGLRYAN